jgi:uncharacterized protein YjcR
MKPENKVILASFPKLRDPKNFHGWGDIAAIFGVSRNRVIALAHRHGWTKEKPRGGKTVRKPSAPRRYDPKENRT